MEPAALTILYLLHTCKSAIVDTNDSKLSKRLKETTPFSLSQQMLKQLYSFMHAEEGKKKLFYFIYISCLINFVIRNFLFSFSAWLNNSLYALLSNFLFIFFFFLGFLILMLYIVKREQ